MFTHQAAVACLLSVTPLMVHSEIEGQTALVDGPRLHFVGESVRLAMPQTGGRSIVDVMIGENGPYAFFIDSGSSVTVIDSGIAETLSPEVVGRVPIGAPGGATVDADRVAMPTFSAGDLTVEDATALVLDIATMTGGVMEGILGMDLFGEFLLSLDPSHERATILRGTLPPDAPGVVQAEGDDGSLIFPVDVAGQTVMAHIDHGSPSGLTLGIELLESVPTLGEGGGQMTAGMVGGTRTVHSHTLDGVFRFAGMEFENPRIGFMDPSPGTANIGSQILNGLVTTLDHRTRRIAFVRADPAPAASRQTSRRGPRQLGIQFQRTPDGAFSTIAAVLPGSLGEELGFKTGDTPLTINGRPMSEFDMAALQGLVGGGLPLRWELERNGERVVIEVP